MDHRSCDVMSVFIHGSEGLVRVTISGHPGSGTSTLVNLLKNRYDWKSLNGGDIFRSEASRRGMTLSDFGKLCESDLSVDKSLDTLLKEKMKEDSSIDIIESRLAGWWAYKLEINCKRIWIKVSEEERARRVVAREGGEVSDKISENRERMEIDEGRFMSLYGIKPQEEEPYTDIIEASNLTPDQVLDSVVKILEGV